MKTSQPNDAWLEHELECVSSCPICHSESQHAVHESLTDLAFESASGKWTMFACGQCRSGYLSPRPKAENIGRAYARYYTHTPDADQGRVSAVILDMRQRLKRERYSSLDETTTSVERFSTMWRKWRHYATYRFVLGQEYRDLDGYGGGRTLLDVGCGNGDFLKRAHAAGWKCEGVDFDAAAVAAAGNDITVHLGGIERFRDDSDRFDVITLSHVIEHVYDPSALIRDCHRLLKEGGYIWIETPNFLSQGHRLFGPHWRGLEPPRHISIFNHKSLKRMLRQAGFSAISDLPWRMTLPWMFDVSALLQQKDGFKTVSVRGRQARKAVGELINLVRPSAREFVTMAARK